MSPDDLKRVLAKVQLGDNRQVDALVMREWFDTIGHLRFEDAIAAVTMHRQESTDYLMPAHIIRNAARARDQRTLESSDRPSQRDYPAHPRPDNFDAMASAWKDPTRFAAEVAVYNDQLRAGGYPEARL